MKKLNKKKDRVPKMSGKSYVSLLTAFSVLFSGMAGVINPLEAEARTVKTFTVTFDESKNPSMSKTISIPDLAKIESVAVDNGTISHTVDDTNVTLNVSNGVVSRTEWNGYKYSKYVTDYQTSKRSNGFSNSMPYSDGSGYSGTIYPYNAPYVTSGEYIPSETKTVYDSKKNNTGSFSSSLWYNSGGFSGNLYKSGSPSSRLISGSYTAPHSKTVYDSETKSYNSFSSSMSYNSGGYAGTLYKDGSASKKQTGGSYIAEDDKIVTEDVTKSSNSFSNSISYNEGGYSGTLGKYGSVDKIQTGGSYTAQHSKTVTLPEFMKKRLDYHYWTGSRWLYHHTVADPSSEPQTQWYSSGGYSGTLYREGTRIVKTKYGDYPNRPKKNQQVAYLWYDRYYHFTGTVTRPASDTRTYKYTQTYRGTVTRPASDTRTYEYTQNYSGKVTKPESDTRVYEYTQNYYGTVVKPAVDTRTWRQNFGGTVYKGGNDSFYKYTVTIKYFDDIVNPTLNVSYDSKTLAKQLTADALATDDKSGVKKIILPDGSEVFSNRATFVIRENGAYTFIAEDNSGNRGSKTINVTNIENQAPNSPTIKTNENWSAVDVPVTISHNGDKGIAGVNRIEYALKGAVDKGWTHYTNSFILSQNGITKVSARVIDNVGNISEESTAYVKVDKIAPTLQASINPASWTKENVTIVLTGSDVISGVRDIQLPNGNWILGSNATYTVTGNGNFDFKVRDNAGNITSKRVTVSLIDKTSPDLELSLSNDEWTNEDISIRASSADIGSGIDKIKLPNGTFVFSSTANFTVSSNGIYTFVASDKVGNQTSKEITVSKIDKTAPTIHLQKNKNEWTKEVIITAKGADAGSGVKRIQLPNGTWVNGSQATYTVATNGLYNFIVEDRVGQQTSQTIVINNTDNVLPQVTHSISPSVWTKGNVIISINAIDSISGVKEIKKPDGSIVEGYATSYTATQEGTYTFEVTDHAGNKTVKKVVISNIDRTAPTAQFTLNTTSWTKNQIMISVQLTDNESGVKSIRLPNGVTVNGSGSSLQTTYTVTSNGICEFTMVDAVGNSRTEKVVIENIDKEQPVLSLSKNVTSYTNGEITITAKATDRLSGVKQIQLPNGTWIAGDEVSYKVKTNGTYIFKAEDLVGNIVTQSIAISNIDTTAPGIPSISNQQEWTKDKPVLVTITAGTDSQSGVQSVEYKLEGATTQGWTTYVGGVSVSNEGITKITAKTIDKVGNVSSEVSTNVKIDISTPHNTGITIKLKP